MAGGDFSGLVTNPLMKKVLSDVAHIDSAKLGKNYQITDKSHSACTSGPTTWYKRAGIHLSFWNGALPYTSSHKNYKKGKRSATVNDMKTSLMNAGFLIVWSGTGQDANSQLGSLGILRPGDVATMLSSNSAHAAMWTGLDWRSDFLQGNRPYPYSSVGRGGNETFILWRYQPFQDNAAQTNNTTVGNTYTNKTNMAKRNKKPKRINNFGNYPAWGLMYLDAQTLLSDYNVNNNIVNLIIQACVNNGLSLNQTAVILANAFLESHFNPNAKNNIAGGHWGVWQFSTNLYVKFGLKDWNKQLNYLMEEVARTPSTHVYKKNKRGVYQMYMPHAGGNGWKARHKIVWDSSDDINQLSWAFGEGWERYGHAKADTDSRTLLAKLFQSYLKSGDFGFNGNNSSILNTASVNYDPNTITSVQPDLQLVYIKPRLSYATNTLPTNTLSTNTYNTPITDTEQTYTNKPRLGNYLTTPDDYVLAEKNLFLDVLNDNNYEDEDFSINYSSPELPSGSFAVESPTKNYVDHSKAFMNYLNSLLSSKLLKGGEIFNDSSSYTIFNVRGNSKFRLPKKALDYRLIIEKIFNVKNSNPALVISDIYKDIQKKKKGGIIKYQNGGLYDIYLENVRNGSVTPIREKDLPWRYRYIPEYYGTEDDIIRLYFKDLEKGKVAAIDASHLPDGWQGPVYENKENKRQVMGDSQSLYDIYKAKVDANEIEPILYDELDWKYKQDPYYDEESAIKAYFQDLEKGKARPLREGLISDNLSLNLDNSTLVTSKKVDLGSLPPRKKLAQPIKQDETQDDYKDTQDDYKGVDDTYVSVTVGNDGKVDAGTTLGSNDKITIHDNRHLYTPVPTQTEDVSRNKFLSVTHTHPDVPLNLKLSTLNKNANDLDVLNDLDTSKDLSTLKSALNLGSTRIDKLYPKAEFTVNPKDLPNIDLPDLSDNSFIVTNDETVDDDLSGSGDLVDDSTLVITTNNKNPNLEYDFYTVQNDDDLVDVAIKFGYNEDDDYFYDYLKSILLLNNMQNSNLVPGLILRIPKINEASSNKYPIVKKEPLVDLTKTTVTKPYVPLPTEPATVISTYTEPATYTEPVIPTLTKTFDSEVDDNKRIINVNFDKGTILPLAAAPNLLVVYSRGSIDNIYGTKLSDPKTLEYVKNGQLGNLSPLDLDILGRLYDIYSGPRFNSRQIDDDLYLLLDAYRKKYTNDAVYDSFYNRTINSNGDKVGRVFNDIINNYKKDLANRGYDNLAVSLLVSNIPFDDKDFVNYLNTVNVNVRVGKDRITKLDVVNYYNNLVSKYNKNANQISTSQVLTEDKEPVLPTVPKQQPVTTTTDNKNPVLSKLLDDDLYSIDDLDNTFGMNLRNMVIDPNNDLYDFNNLSETKDKNLLMDIYDYIYSREEYKNLNNLDDSLFDVYEGIGEDLSNLMYVFIKNLDESDKERVTYLDFIKDEGSDKYPILNKLLKILNDYGYSLLDTIMIFNYVIQNGKIPDGIQVPIRGNVSNELYQFLTDYNSKYDPSNSVSNVKYRLNPKPIQQLPTNNKKRR